MFFHESCKYLMNNLQVCPKMVCLSFIFVFTRVRVIIRKEKINPLIPPIPHVRFFT